MKHAKKQEDMANSKEKNKSQKLLQRKPVF